MKDATVFVLEVECTVDFNVRVEWDASVLREQRRCSVIHVREMRRTILWEITR